MTIRIKLAAALTIAALSTLPALGADEQPMLFQDPSISETAVVFAFAGDLWTAPRAGGTARRLTAGSGVESRPRFSPDGSRVAFTGEYDGNTDVYLVPAAGGVPRRLTHHPGADYVIGWTPDGTQILFASSRLNFSSLPQLFMVSVEGGYPEPLPLNSGTWGSYSPDGRRLAYVPKAQWQRSWKRYQGGQTYPVWIVDLGDLAVEKVPRENSNDFDPMWVGDRIYFLSDRNGAVSLFAYDLAKKSVTEVLPNDGFDFKSASAGPGGIVIEQLGTLLVFDPATGKARKLDVRLEGDLAEVRPRFVKVGGRIEAANVSPNGARAVFEARGEILTVPAEKGDIRNLTRTTGIMERDPSWSPDGRSIAYFSEASGEYALHIIDQAGKGPIRKIVLGEPPSFYYRPVWSPDGKKIAYNDKRLAVWYVDLDRGVPVKVDTTYYFNPVFRFNVGWSPDSRWLVYNKQLKNHFNAVCVYSLDAGKASQVTDGLSDAVFPAFDKSGKYLFFAASTDVGLLPGRLNMSSMDRPLTRSIYIAVLAKDLPSPLAAESDEEKPKDEEKADKAKSLDKPAKDKKDAAKPDDRAKEPARVVIDLDGIGQRILALPIEAKDYVGLAAGKEGILFIHEGEPVTSGFLGSPGRILHKFDLATRKLDKFLEGVNGFVLSASGEKILLNQAGSWSIVATAGPLEPGKGVLKTGDMEVYAEPLVEWKQMFHEAFRIERDFFYDPGLHGLDLKAWEARYAPFLEGVGSRGDLNYLFDDIFGELTCGHVFVNGGDLPEVKPVATGLLGADYEVAGGRYLFARVYDGENWNPRLKAPLTQPGVNVKKGEYLLAVNGRDVPASEEIFRFFVGTAGKQTVLKVGPSSDGAGAREVTVVPVANEYGLRNRAWIEDNRRKVDALSGGKLGYVYLPDTAEGGFSYFNRYYFAQVGKEGVVVDERFNGGGLIADYIIDYMRRPLAGYFAAREGADYITPVGSIYGPKAMIINEYAGSGGDMMPWLFRAAGIGPLVGTRTWGGLVGMAGAVSLMDGGSVGAPQSGFWNPNGTWDVENYGVAPDIEVEMDPASVKAGRDPQLEKAVAVVLDLLTQNPPAKHTKPAYPVYKREW